MADKWTATHPDCILSAKAYANLLDGLKLKDVRYGKLKRHDDAWRALVRELVAILKEENETMEEPDGDCFVCGASGGERHDVACMYAVIDRAEVVTR